MSSFCFIQWSIEKNEPTFIFRGVVFYKDSNEIVVGVLLWNIFNQMSTARRIVKENKRYDDLSEVAKLFRMYNKNNANIVEETTADEMEKEKD